MLEAGAVDLLIGGDVVLAPAMRATTLLQDRPVIVQRKGHPRGDRAFTLGELTTLPYATTRSIRHQRLSSIDKALADEGYARRIDVASPGYDTTAMIVAQTDLIADMPFLIASYHANALEIFCYPLAVAPYLIRAAWHERKQNDPARSWLRERISGMFRTVT